MGLSELYDNPKQAAFLHPQEYLEGCLLGACACPEIPLPDVWMPWVIKQHKQIESPEQVERISDVLFAFFKARLADMHNDTVKLPEYARVAKEMPYDKKDYRALSLWAQGLLMAHSAREAYWQNAWDKMQQQVPDKAPVLAKDLSHCLLMFSTFADPQKTISEATKKGDKQLLEKLPIIAQSLQKALEKYVAISGQLAQYLPNQFETFSNGPNHN
ncbi:UPF0149 family protein [Glaciecola petra]|uniref:UPF0149 family protein n=1 Tax=Glaciecola petra TaxID=3075602 RepID=A0ABU2ZS95_9ALTE|nr:UPF0149 family protein [Aestuariibacter sp. P117]MDT0595501.1 UPF0149 family protein [Aestuariibacter sp. P117]